MRSKTLAAALVLSALAAPACLAQSGPDVIETRQAGYDLMGGLAEAMKAAVAAKSDPKAFADDADAMARWGRLIPALFPPGSGEGHDTKAKPEIWTDRAGFEKAAADFAAAAGKLSEAAKSGDPDAFAAQFKATGAACGACHKAYKVRS
jgi:cytochrome c556